MSYNRDLKAQKVKQINKQINDAKALVIFEYQGLNVSALKDLRNDLKDNDVQAKIFKNRLFKLALNKTPYQDLEKILTGPNMFVFGNEDENILAKKIAQFIEKSSLPNLKIKAGIYEGKVLDEAEMKELIALPTHREALMQLITLLLSPLRHINLMMNIISEKQANV